MQTITLDGNNYDVYADVSTADIYLAGQISTAGDAYRAADTATKSRGLISATRFLDRQLWRGTRLDSYYPHAFPREGLTYPDGGDEVSSSEVPQEVIDASCELAALLIEGSDIQGSATTESLVQSLKAGSVSITYFRSDAELLSRLPQILQELLGYWLAGGDQLTSQSFGTDRESEFEDTFEVNEGI